MLEINNQKWSNNKKKIQTYNFIWTKTLLNIYGYIKHFLYKQLCPSPWTLVHDEEIFDFNIQFHLAVSTEQNLDFSKSSLTNSEIHISLPFIGLKSKNGRHNLRSVLEYYVCVFSWEAVCSVSNIWQCSRFLSNMSQHANFVKTCWAYEILSTNIQTQRRIMRTFDTKILHAQKY